MFLVIIVKFSVCCYSINLNTARNGKPFRLDGIYQPRSGDKIAKFDVLPWWSSNLCGKIFFLKVIKIRNNWNLCTTFDKMQSQVMHVITKQFVVHNYRFTAWRRCCLYNVNLYKVLYHHQHLPQSGGLTLVFHCNKKDSILTYLCDFTLGL